MPEIGETLRETRMRRRIDMTEVEAATKIRAKYLRALENEEWDLLPGPTFVKTFLRTYAEYLDLDPRLLVEEYRQRFERPTTQDLTPFRPEPGRQRRRASASGARSARSWSWCSAILIVLGALYMLGRWGDDNDDEAPNTRRHADRRRRPRRPRRHDGEPRRKRRRPRRRACSLKLTADRPRVRVPRGRDGQGRWSTACTSRRARAPRRSARALPRQLRQRRRAR